MRRKTPMKPQKTEVISFKADAALLEALAGVRNRSDFIRQAVLAALRNTCPLCGGTGVLTPSQMQHLTDFLAEHAVEECDECHERHLVCLRGEGA
jgi:hypothetical protein